MAGSIDGGLKAAHTNKKKYGRGFYAKIGALGGKQGKTGGFFANRELASVAGTKGGQISKRGHRFIGFDKDGEPQYQRTI
jgi:general stress protein YciG